MDHEQRSLDVARSYAQRPREVPDDHEEAVPITKGEARAARLLRDDAELVENLPDADVDYPITARVKESQDRGRHGHRDTLQRAQEL
ncbi:MAG: hypothetical protein HY615_12845 [Candidatus Rokubacteria bacterium]|nr:hypothetical protein [Candidatus Rokubacteria bacterium]